MNFEEFLTAVMNDLQERLGDEYRMERKSVRGVNSSIKHSLMLVKSGMNMYPLVPMEQWYQYYSFTCKDIGKIAEKICESCKEHIHSGNLDISRFTQWDSAKNNIHVKLINTEKNKELLREVPHREYLDLSQVYYITLQEAGTGENAVFQVRNEYMELWGVDESILHDTAWKNMKNDDVIFEKMSDVLNAFVDAGEMEPVDGIDDTPTYVLGNKSGHNGAVYICNEKILYNISCILKDDFWLLPSSVHETLLIPKQCMEDKLWELVWVVSEVNNSELDPEEILSYHVYCYNRTLRKLVIAG